MPTLHSLHYMNVLVDYVVFDFDCCLCFFFKMVFAYWAVKDNWGLLNCGEFEKFIRKRFWIGKLAKEKFLKDWVRCRQAGFIDSATMTRVTNYYISYCQGHYTRCFDMKDLSCITAAFVKKLWGKYKKFACICITCTVCNKQCYLKFLEAFKSVDSNFCPLPAKIEELAKEYYSAMTVKKCLDPRWDCPLRVPKNWLDVVREEGVGNDNFILF